VRVKLEEINHVPAAAVIFGVAEDGGPGARPHEWNGERIAYHGFWTANCRNGSKHARFSIERKASCSGTLA
jgi:hypothetical protein